MYPTTYLAHSPKRANYLGYFREKNPHHMSIVDAKGPRFSEKDWYYLQALTDMPFHYLTLVV